MRDVIDNDGVISVYRERGEEREEEREADEIKRVLFFSLESNSPSRFFFF